MMLAAISLEALNLEEYIMKLFRLFSTEIESPAQIDYVSGVKWSDERRAEHTQKVSEAIERLGTNYILHPINKVSISKKYSILEQNFIQNGSCN